MIIHGEVIGHHHLDQEKNLEILELQKGKQQAENEKLEVVADDNFNPKS